MRAVKKILFPLFAILTLIGCQKELSEENGRTPNTTPTIDSAWYVGTSQFINYDTLGNVIDTVTEHYQYDSAKIKLTIITASPSSSPDSVTKTFYYNADGNILSYELNNNSAPSPLDILSLTFNYTGTDISRIVYTYRNGYTGTIQVTTQPTATGKTIITYDTITPSFFPPPYRRYTKNILNLNQRGDIESGQAISVNSDLIVAGAFRLDTVFLNFQYDATTGNLRNYKSFLRYLDTVYGIGRFEQYNFDSISYISRDTRGIELYNTHKKLFSNAFLTDDNEFFLSNPSITSFYNTNLYSNGGGSAIVYRFPPISATRVLNQDNPTANNVVYVSNYQLTFDNNNRLTKMVYPKYFTAKGGKSEASYTYIKTRK